MELKEYANEIKRTMPNLGTNELDGLHMAIGIATEAGEVLDVYKKNLAYGKDLDVVNIKEELGDLMWYAVNLCTLLGADMRELLDTNVAKLRLRYPEGFTEDSAINRDLEAERALLESQ